VARGARREALRAVGGGRTRREALLAADARDASSFAQSFAVTAGYLRHVGLSTLVSTVHLG